MIIRKLKQRTRLSEWRTAIQQQKASGQSIKQWCKENNCTEGKYYHRLKQVRQEMLEQGVASTVALVQFELGSPPVAADEKMNADRTPLCYIGLFCAPILAERWKSAATKWKMR